MPLQGSSQKLNGLKMPSTDKPKVAFIVGPTGVGKTSLSLEIAEALNAEIISADSRYLYRGMNIGTAKPTQEELARIPHYLVDVADVNDNWSLAEYHQSAVTAMDRILDKGKMPLVVGGTGQYIRALIEGWEVPSRPPEPALREALTKLAEEIGGFELHRRLEILDPEAAWLIDHRNVRRTIRAMEVIFHTGELFSKQRNRKPIGFSYKMAGLNRPRIELYKRIDERIEGMINSGFVDEVRYLLDQGYSLENPPMSAIGYKEMITFLNEECTLAESVVEIKKRTRQFVRHQANWFKETDKRIRWFAVGSTLSGEIIDFFNAYDGWLEE